MPLDNGKYSEIVPFVMRALFAYLYVVLIQPMNRSPKLNFFLKSHGHSTRSKAFSWSRRSIMESSDFELIISSNSRIFSPIYLPFMHPLWSVWIISGSTVFILSAKALDRILKSVFRSEIGLQFLMSVLHPFYPSALRHGPGGWAGGRAGGWQTCETHISVTAWWIFSIRSSVELSRPVGVHCYGHMPICPIWACPWAKNLSNLPQIGSRLCGSHISETAGWIYPI